MDEEGRELSGVDVDKVGKQHCRVGVDKEVVERSLVDVGGEREKNVEGRCGRGGDVVYC